MLQWVLLRKTIDYQLTRTWTPKFLFSDAAMLPDVRWLFSETLCNARLFESQERGTRDEKAKSRTQRRAEKRERERGRERIIWRCRQYNGQLWRQRMLDMLERQHINASTYPYVENVRNRSACLRVRIRSTKKPVPTVAVSFRKSMRVFGRVTSKNCQTMMISIDMLVYDFTIYSIYIILLKNGKLIHD